MRDGAFKCYCGNLLPLLECGEPLAALESLGVRQFIAALEYFGLRYVLVPLSIRDTSRVALEQHYVPHRFDLQYGSTKR